MALLSNGLLPASFRGVPFAVQGDSMGGGRRVAVHTYFKRDTPWAEDIGRAVRSYSFRGFIVTDDVIFLGGPIQLQRLLLLAALEKAGPGTLVHPTLGILNVSLTDFSLGQDLGAGRWSSVDLKFVESGKKSFPSLLSSSSGLLSAATLSDVAIALDFARVAATIITATGAGDAASSAASSYAAQVVAQGQDATALQNLTAQLPGNNGRYAGGANIGFTASTASPYAADTTVDLLIADASAQRTAIATAAAEVDDAAAALSDATSFATLTSAMTALVAALVASCADPADAVRLLMTLIANPPTLPAPATTAGTTVVMAFQRAAAAALARACSQYQPTSYDDAVNLLANVSSLLDTVAIAAADAGDDSTFDALNALLAQVVSDLQARGADLAPIKTFAFAAALPDIVLAQRIYKDPTRADQLLAQCPEVINPLFMPLSFQALAA